MESFSLGKKGKFGEIDLSKISNGIEAKDICNDELQKSLFNIIDKDGNGKLSSNEIQELIKNLDKNNDNKISNKELNSLRNNDKKLNNQEKKQFLNILNNIAKTC